MTKVLVVDDEPQIVRALRINLSARGYEVLTAPDGATALRLAADGKPDVVVLDLGLPDMDGWQALRLIRADARAGGLRIVAFTADAMVGDRERALAGGFDGYLSKPIDFATFAESVERYLP